MTATDTPLEMLLYLCECHVTALLKKCVKFLQLCLVKSRFSALSSWQRFNGASLPSFVQELLNPYDGYLKNLGNSFLSSNARVNRIKHPFTQFDGISFHVTHIGKPYMKT